jgi:hypothetical protein
VDEVVHLILAVPVKDVALEFHIGSLDLACPSSFKHGAQIVVEKVK